MPFRLFFLRSFSFWESRNPAEPRVRDAGPMASPDEGVWAYMNLLEAATTPGYNSAHIPGGTSHDIQQHSLAEDDREILR